MKPHKLGAEAGTDHQQGNDLQPIPRRHCIYCAYAQRVYKTQLRGKAQKRVVRGRRLIGVFMLPNAKIRSGQKRIALATSPRSRLLHLHLHLHLHLDVRLCFQAGVPLTLHGCYYSPA